MISFFNKKNNNTFYKKKITLLVHHNPDGDALGSSLALFFYFKKLECDVCLISTTEYSEFFNWLPGTKNILVFSEKTKNLIKEKFFQSDYIFFIDFNQLSRLGFLQNFFQFSKNSKKILIDHHPLSIQYSHFDLMFSDSKAPATSILVFKFISDMNNGINLIDNDIATCLYVGLITDTGFFRLPTVNYETHFIAAKLIRIGEIDLHYVHNQLQEKYHEKKLKILSKALKRLKVIKKYRTAYTYIHSLDLIKLYSSSIQNHSSRKGDTEGIVNYGLNINNILLSVFFFEEKEKNSIKISFRSKGNFDVNFFSRKHFSGGGHKNAAGGIVFKKNLYETINYFLNIIQNYSEFLSGK